MKVSRETFRTVRWLLIGLLAVQLLIVPWTGGPFDDTVYRPIFAPFFGSTVNVGRLLVQLAVTGGLLLLWLRVAKPEE